jgi:hypothetical protein
MLSSGLERIKATRLVLAERRDVGQSALSANKM